MVNFQKKAALWLGGPSHRHAICCEAPGAALGTGSRPTQSIRRNFLEETYEALDAIDRDDTSGMQEELGDVLMQVVFHAAMEEEQGHFTADDVVDGVAQKLVFRHAHVFGNARGRRQRTRRWRAGRRRRSGRRAMPPRRTPWRPCPTRCPPCGGRKRWFPAP